MSLSPHSTTNPENPSTPNLVKKARREEMAYFKEMKVYDKVKVEEGWAATGAARIPVSWVDINKGDSVEPAYRSRLDAKELRTDDRLEWFAATPPGEC